MIVKRIVPTLAAFALSLPMVAQASTSFLFNPTGGGAAGALTLGSLDPAAGSALSVGGNPAPAGVQVGDVNKLLYQANMITGLNSVGDPVALGANFTLVAGFQERVISTPSTATTVTANFEFGGVDALSTDNFFYIYAGGPGASLAGTGFTTGTLILSGHVSSVQSSTFTLSTTGIAGGCSDAGATIKPLDCFGADNWGGTSTLVGSGATDLQLTIDSVNAGYFPDLMAGATMTFGFINTSLVDPFSQTNPSQNFSSDGVADGNYAANVGAINGFNGTQNETFDFIFQADANLSFDRTVPEPGSLALLGLALTAAGYSARRRRLG